MKKNSLYISVGNEPSERLVADVLLTLKVGFPHIDIQSDSRNSGGSGVPPEMLASHSRLLLGVSLRKKARMMAQAMATKRPLAVVLVGFSPLHRLVLKELAGSDIPLFVIAQIPSQFWPPTHKVEVHQAGAQLLDLYGSDYGQLPPRDGVLLGHPYMNRLAKIKFDRAHLDLGLQQDCFVVPLLLPPFDKGLKQRRARTKAFKTYNNLQRLIEIEGDRKWKLLLVDGTDPSKSQADDFIRDPHTKLVTYADDVLSIADFAFVFEEDHSLRAAFLGIPHIKLNQGRVKTVSLVNRICDKTVVKSLMADVSGRRLFEYLKTISVDQWQRSQQKRDFREFCQFSQPFQPERLLEIFWPVLNRKVLLAKRRLGA